MKKLSTVLVAILFTVLFATSCGDKGKTEPANTDSTAMEINGGEELFDEKVETKEISNKELPAEVIETIEYQYSGAEIKEIEMLSNGLDVTYKITIKRNSEDILLHITETGKILIK